jgi:hypothetical protein
MRAWDLAVFIIMIEMSIGFLAGLQGLYLYTPYLNADQGGEISTYQQNITDPGGIVKKEVSIGDYLKFGLDWIFASFNMIVMIVTAFVAFSWILYHEFGLPIELCLFIQGIVYLIYTWGFIQWKSGKGGQAFE